MTHPAISQRQQHLKAIIDHTAKGIINYININIRKSSLIYTATATIEQNTPPNLVLMSIYLIKDIIKIQPNTPRYDIDTTRYNLSDPHALEKIAQQIEHIYQKSNQPLIDI